MHPCALAGAAVRAGTRAETRTVAAPTASRRSRGRIPLNRTPAARSIVGSSPPRDLGPPNVRGRTEPREEGVLLEQVAQDVLHDPAVAVVVRLARGVDADDRVELDVVRPSTFTVRGVVPSLSAVTPVIEKVSSPVSPSDSAFSPSGYCSGSTPMPIRFDRWIRS